MKGFIILLLLAVTVTTSCKKKEAGICYCSYVSGDKKEFDLKALSTNAARDSCAVLDRNANGFGGDCEIK
jgi:hypothetical protein